MYKKSTHYENIFLKNVIDFNGSRSGQDLARYNSAVFYNAHCTRD